MKLFITILPITWIFFCFTSCSNLPKKVNANETQSVSGFDYNYPSSGEWFHGQASSGMQTIGKKPSADGATTLAVVRWGQMGISSSEIEAARKQGKKVIPAYTEAQVLASFRKDIETDAAVGRVKNIRTNFTEKKYDPSRIKHITQ